MKLADLAGRRVALLGLGADVWAAIPAIEAAGPASMVAVEAGVVPDGCRLPLVTLDEAAESAEVFVRSPGFPRYSPALAEAMEQGSLMTTPVDLWMGTVGPGRRVAAVTGTKGKSTVVSLVSLLAEMAGVRVGIAGNLGPPVFSTGWDHEAPIVVLEVSSYQAADLHHVPEVAVLTFLSQDHLSWHGGRDRYVADKLRVLHNEAGTADLILVGVDGGDALDAVLDLAVDFDVIRPPDAPVTVPPHRLRNAALAGAVLAALGGPSPSAEEVVTAARSSMPGRLDECDGPDDLLCLDDALASNPSAVAAALGWLRSIERATVVLLGGDDRGVDVAPLRAEVARWPESTLVAVGLPGSADLARRCGVELAADVESVEQGTQLAVELARRLPGPEQPAVLLSPGAPTPVGAGTWKERSASFRSALDLVGR